MLSLEGMVKELFVAEGVVGVGVRTERVAYKATLDLIAKTFKELTNDEDDINVVINVEKGVLVTENMTKGLFNLYYIPTQIESNEDVLEFVKLYSDIIVNSSNTGSTVNAIKELEEYCSGVKNGGHIKIDLKKVDDVHALRLEKDLFDYENRCGGSIISNSHLGGLLLLTEKKDIFFEILGREITIWYVGSLIVEDAKRLLKEHSIFFGNEEASPCYIEGMIPAMTAIPKIFEGGPKPKDMLDFDVFSDNLKFHVGIVDYRVGVYTVNTVVRGEVHTLFFDDFKCAFLFVKELEQAIRFNVMDSINSYQDIVSNINSLREELFVDMLG